MNKGQNYEMEKPIPVLGWLTPTCKWKSWKFLLSTIHDLFANNKLCRELNSYDYH